MVLIAWLTYATNIDRVIGAPYHAARVLATVVKRDITLFVSCLPSDDLCLERLRTEVEEERRRLGLQNTIHLIVHKVFI